MKLSSAAVQLLAASGLLALVVAACGGHDSDGGGSGTPGLGESGTGSGGDGQGDATGISGSPGSDGPDLSLGGDTGSGSGIDDPIDTCAGELIEAKYLPLDMYIMLDKSGSMLDPTDGDPNQTKWQAVSAALTEFLSDGESDGLGVGLQLFPLLHPDAPASCKTDQQCAAFGPCLTRGCWPLQDGILSICLDESDCSIFQNCVEYGECANDTNYVCNHETTANCGMGLGACTVPASTCLMSDDCRPQSYAAPAAPIATLPDAAQALLDVISATEPDGLTPSGPALTGAIDQATSWAEQHPDHQVVAVLATDGLPTLQQDAMSCEAITLQSEIDAVAQIAAAGLAGTPSIRTFVIGVMGPNDIGGPETLSAIASQGGTTEAFIVDTLGDVSAQFRAALNQIRGSRLACVLAVPEAEAGKTIDFLQVNVTFDDGSGPDALFYVEQASGCDAQTGGWYYDQLPEVGTPERIVVCPTTCEQFQDVAMGSVQIQLGCETRVSVK